MTGVQTCALPIYVAGAKVTIALGATKGGEAATWAKDGKELVLNLVENETYSQDDIDKLIANADSRKADGIVADLSLKLKNGVMSATTAGSTDATVAGVRASADATDIPADLLSSAISGYGDKIGITSNSYGLDTRKISFVTDAQAGKENVTTKKADTAGAKDGEFVIHLSTGKEYTAKDIEDLLKSEGLDYSIDITDTNSPDGDVTVKFDKTTNDATKYQFTMDNGAGIGKDEVATTGKGLTFQIGANGVEDQRVTLNVNDMSSTAIGVANADVSNQDAANKAIEMVDTAVKTVSMQRAGLGALQNRLEYTVNNLTTTNENLTAAESQIRDTDMATEMINYTKNNILQQASQAMLAQANQQPQAILQLLQ